MHSCACAACPYPSPPPQVRRSEGKALEFRRGSTPASITGLVFSPQDAQPRVLCASSNHGTVHIFRLHAPCRRVSSCFSTLIVVGSGPELLESTVRPAQMEQVLQHCRVCRHPAAKAAQTLLSAMIPGVEPQRPLATVRLPAKGQPTICAVVRDAPQDDSSPALGEAAPNTRLVVATGEGMLYMYRLELPSSDVEDSSAPPLHSLEGEWNLASTAT